MNEPNLRPYGEVREQPAKPAQGSAVLGFFLVVGLHVVWGAFPLMYLFLGVVQVLYVAPVIVIALARNKQRTAAGAAIAAGVTLLAQGVFCGLVFSGALNL